jgi:hypothetical protein
MFETPQELPSPTDLGGANTPQESGDDLSTLEFCMTPDVSYENTGTKGLSELSSALVPIDQLEISPMAELAIYEYETDEGLAPAAEQDVAYIRGDRTGAATDIAEQTYVEMLARQASQERNEQRRGGFLMVIADVLIDIIQSVGGEDPELQSTRESLSASLGHPCMTINTTEPTTSTTEIHVPTAAPTRQKRSQADQVLEGDIIDPVDSDADGDLDAITDGSPNIAGNVIDGEIISEGSILDGATSPLALEHEPVTADGLLSAMGSLSFTNPEQESIMTALFGRATDILSDRVPA